MLGSQFLYTYVHDVYVYGRVIVYFVYPVFSQQKKNKWLLDSNEKKSPPTAVEKLQSIAFAWSRSGVLRSMCKCRSGQKRTLKPFQLYFKQIKLFICHCINCVPYAVFLYVVLSNYYFMFSKCLFISLSMRLSISLGVLFILPHFP